MTIDYLANHQGSISQLATWGYTEWRPIYDQLKMTFEDVINALKDRARIDSLPLALVAIIDHVVVGTGSLKTQDLALRPNLSPWLGGMFVDPTHRNHGVGTALIVRLIQEAKRLKLPRLYLWTPSAEPLYAKHGWSTIERLQYCGYEVSLMELVL